MEWKTRRWRCVDMSVWRCRVNTKPIRTLSLRSLGGSKRMKGDVGVGANISSEWEGNGNGMLRSFLFFTSLVEWHVTLTLKFTYLISLVLLHFYFPRSCFLFPSHLHEYLWKLVGASSCSSSNNNDGDEDDDSDCNRIQCDSNLNVT